MLPTDRLARAAAQGVATLTLERRRKIAVAAASSLVLAAAALVVYSAVAANDPSSFVASHVHPLDSDGDGIPDAVENAVTGTDSQRTITRTLPEAWVLRYGLDLSDPLLPNRTAAYPLPPDSPLVYGPDGYPAHLRLTIWEVYAHGRPADWDEAQQGAWDSGLDPTKFDVDGSGVPYAWLIHFGLDPLAPEVLDRVADVPGVTWTAREAYERGLHPTSVDGDGDGLLDVTEREIGADPWRYSTAGTGVADGWLVAHGLDPLDPTVVERDAARSGMTVGEKFHSSMEWRPHETLQGGGLDPGRMSTVGGPIPDGWLARYGYDPFDPNAHDVVTEREVGDDSSSSARTLTLLQEYRANRPPLWSEPIHGPWWGGTNPRSNDTDGDGLTDLEELYGWSVSLRGQPRHVKPDPTRADTDSDGLTDLQERRGRVGDVTFPATDPTVSDTDFDRLPDGVELGLVAWSNLTLPRLDPTSEDTDGDGLLDGDEAEYWLRRHDDYVLRGMEYQWGPSPRPTASAALGQFTSAAEGGLSALLPGGDVNGNGIPNILDLDSDSDGLHDGWEVQPRQYATSPFASEFARSATDPANPDTDLDGLPDEWETTFALYDARLGGWNLDPAKWSSFGDATSDADRDLDGDGTEWYRFVGTNGAERAIGTTFRASNRVEYDHKSNPNAPSSSPDGIPDGWKIFWGSVYPTLPLSQLGDAYPGAPGDLRLPHDRPLPQIGADDSYLITSVSYVRHARTSDVTFLRGEVADPELSRPPATARRGEMNFTYRLASEFRTNPYSDDTDGDGAPDAWEVLWSRIERGREGVSPVAIDAHLDLDSDGLTSADEARAGGNPFLADSDFGGAPDAIEALVGLDLADPRDDAHALDDGVDSDLDGLSDRKESVGFASADGTIVRTNPRDPDTDRDGLADGPTLSRALGRRLALDSPADAALVDSLSARGLHIVRFRDGTADVLGELDVRTRPDRTSTAGDGIPDGWKVSHGLSTGSAPELAASYGFARPVWWNESAHGVWWWGLRPGEQPLEDRDHDGLNDNNGEDPMPAVNRRNTLLLGSPLDPGLSPAERLRRAQAFGDFEASSVNHLPERASAVVQLDALGDRLIANGSSTFSGRVLTTVGEPVVNTPVLLSLESRATVIGVAITDSAGRFSGPVHLALQIPAPPDSEGIPLFGAADGAGVFENPRDRMRHLAPGRPVNVFAWSYNTSVYPLPAQNMTYELPSGHRAPGVLGSESPRESVFLAIPSSISLQVPKESATATDLPIEIELTDGLGRPIGPAPVHIMPWNVSVQTDESGRATLALPLGKQPGTFRINVTFGGMPPGILASATSAEVKTLRATRLLVDSPPFSPRVGENVTLSGRLVAEDGAPVNATNVSVAYAGMHRAVPTGVGGLFQVMLVAPASPTDGRLKIAVAFEGSPELQPTTTSLNLTILKSPSLRLLGATAILGGTVNVSALLLDEVGDPIVNGSVDLVDWRGSSTTRLTGPGGYALFTVPLGSTPPGVHPISATFQQAVAGHADATASVLVVAQTVVRLDARDLLRGNDGKLVGALTLPSGTPLPGRAVRVLVAGNESEVLTDRAGRFEVLVPSGGDRKAGEVFVSARFPGSPDGVYLPSSREARISLKDELHIEFDGQELPLSQPRVAGVVRTALDEPVVSAEITLRGSWGATRAITTHDGRFEATLSLPAGQALGPLAINYTVVKSSLEVPTAGELIMTVKDSATITLDVEGPVAVGGRIVAHVEVRDSMGRPVADAIPTLLLDGQVLDIDPRARPLTATLPPHVAPGPHLLLVRVTSAVVSAREVQHVLDVRAHTSLALVSKDAVALGRQTEVRLSLDSSGEPLSNRTVLVHRPGHPTLLVHANSLGEVVVPVVVDSPDPIELTVVYSGDGLYTPSAAGVQLLATSGASLAKSPVALHLSLTLGLLALAVVTVVLLRLRRGAPGDVLRTAARRMRLRGAGPAALYAAYADLLDLVGVSEDEAEAWTFGDLLARVVSVREGVDDEITTLSEAFNRAVYAPALLTDEALRSAADALDRLGRSIERRAPPALTSADGGAG